MAWRVLGMLPSFKKSATPNETAMAELWSPEAAV